MKGSKNGSVNVVLAVALAVAVLVIGFLFVKIVNHQNNAQAVGAGSSGSGSVVDSNYPMTPGEVLKAMITAYGGLDKADSESAKKYLTDNAINGTFPIGEYHHGVLSVWRMYLTDKTCTCTIDYNVPAPTDGTLTVNIPVSAYLSNYQKTYVLGRFILVLRDGRWQVDGYLP